MRFAAGFFAIVFLVSSALAQIQPTWVHSDFASTQIEGYQKRYNVPGLSIAVAVKGQLVFAKGFGFADVEKQVPVRPADYFRLASVSKPITATLIFELAEQGKLDIEAPIRQVLPELPLHHIYRICDLLSHQAGVRHYQSDPPLRNYPTSTSALERFVNDPLLFPHGEKYSYSTHAYTILGAVIEKVTKKPFRLYVDDRMKAWGVDGIRCESGTNANRTKIYRVDQGLNKPTVRDDLSWKYPGGGFEANSLGLIKLGLAISQGKILKKDTLARMWTVQKPRTGDTRMAWGWNITDADGHAGAEHSGSQPGSNANWRIQYNDDTVVVVLSNRDSHRPGNLATYLASLTYRGKDDKLPELEVD